MSTLAPMPQRDHAAVELVLGPDQVVDVLERAVGVQELLDGHRRVPRRVDRDRDDAELLAGGTQPIFDAAEVVDDERADIGAVDVEERHEDGFALVVGHRDPPAVPGPQSQFGCCADRLDGAAQSTRSPPARAVRLSTWRAFSTIAGPCSPRCAGRAATSGDGEDGGDARGLPGASRSEQLRRVDDLDRRADLAQAGFDLSGASRVGDRDDRGARGVDGTGLLQAKLSRQLGLRSCCTARRRRSSARHRRPRRTRRHPRAAGRGAGARSSGHAGGGRRHERSRDPAYDVLAEVRSRAGLCTRAWQTARPARPTPGRPASNSP